VLDQRAHRSACVEARQLFAGLAPAAGLALGPGTIVHAVPADDARAWGRLRFEVELAGEFLVSGDFLPSRRRTNQVLAVERAERARLDVRRAGESLRVDNNLGITVEALLVRDPEGRLHWSSGALAPGASAELRIAGEQEGSASDALLATTLPLTAARPSESVPPGCYLARLARSPFRDDCGIETNELASAHVVLGVLSLADEDWK
jgi:hypothetical protein